jgi:hypothetical protein
MLEAITRIQVEEVISLVERLSEARKVRAAEGKTQSFDEIFDDPQRRDLAKYLYSLNDQARGELIGLMLVGRGDVKHSYERALETMSKHTTADDQVSYLMGKTFYLADHLRSGLETVSNAEHDAQM